MEQKRRIINKKSDKFGGEHQKLMYRHTAGQAKRFMTHFDSHFTRIMGRGNYGGSAVGECYETASRIVDGDFESYARAWEKTAKRVEEIGRKCLRNNHLVSAREAFLRATTYWGASTMYLSPTDSRQRLSYEKARNCFREAAKLFNPIIEVVEVPYENNRALPGYFIKGGDSDEKKPTILMLGGGDSALEELYGISVGAQQRGYNVLMFEVPGQKSMFFNHPDLFFRHDAEVPIGYAVDYVLRRTDVDKNRLVLIGSSFGGYFAGRAAAFEKRLTAVVALPIIWAPGEIAVELLGLDPTRPYPNNLESQLDMSKSIVRTVIHSDIRMRCGFANTTIKEWLEGMRKFTLTGIEKEIKRPLLVIAGESEYDPIRMEKEKMKWQKVMNHPKSQIRIGTVAEGGEGHGLVNNLPLKNQIEMDWLDEVLVWKP